MGESAPDDAAPTSVAAPAAEPTSEADSGARADAQAAADDTVTKDPEATAADAEDMSGLEQELDEETAALLAELEESEAELRRVIDAQSAQTAALDIIKGDLTKQVKDLSEETWRLRAYCELEDMKKQLVQGMTGEGAVPEEQNSQELVATLLELERKIDSAAIAGPSTSSGDRASTSDADAVGDGKTSLQQLMDAAAVSDATVAEVRSLVEEDAALDAQLGDMQSQLDTARAAAEEFLKKQRALEAQLSELMCLAEAEEGSKEPAEHPVASASVEGQASEPSAEATEA